MSTTTTVRDNALDYWQHEWLIAFRKARVLRQFGDTEGATHFLLKAAHARRYIDTIRSY